MPFLLSYHFAIDGLDPKGNITLTFINGFPVRRYQFLNLLS